MALALIEVLAVVLVIVIGDCVVVLVSVRLDSLIIQSASSRVSWRSAMEVKYSSKEWSSVSLLNLLDGAPFTGGTNKAMETKQM